MTALSADARRRIRNDVGMKICELPVVTGQIVYHGSLVNYVTSTKRVRAATAATSRRFAGLNIGPTVTGNTAGTAKAKLGYDMEVFLANNTALTSAYIGVDAAISDDNTVTTGSNAGTAAVRVGVGQTVEIESNDWWVWLRGFRGVYV